jgi:hypothetical protein
MSLHDGWTALRHGGNLLSPAALEVLPEPPPAPWNLTDHLRTALVDLNGAPGDTQSTAALLDVVLEDACGLEGGWEKGTALGAAEGERLLDGTVLKPRRRWTGPGEETLPVFSTRARRIGVGRGRRPAAHVVEYLRRRDLPVALLTNGIQWRLIWADTDSAAWVEWEADRWLLADRLTDEFRVLRRVLSRTCLVRDDRDLSPLLTGIRDTRRGQARLSKELGERVRRAVETLLRSRASLVGPAWNEHEGSDVYVAACHFVMRFVVILFAEARELLPTENPVYHQAYGLRGLLDQLDRMTPERRRARHMAWPRLLALFRLLHEGSPHPAITVPTYGGDLFRPGDTEGDGVQRALALLERLETPPDDDVVHRVLALLTRTTQKVREGSGARTVAAPVDFTELTSEYIGILYEGLLDYELHRAGEEPVVFLNLGDQPALPLDRLELMDDKGLAALVEKAKVKKSVSSGDEDSEDEDDDPEEPPEPEDDEDSDEDDEEGDNTSPEDDEGSEDDLRAEARARARAWGRRAAAVGKLVRKPRSQKAKAKAAYEADLDTAADQLVADLKLPGELYLVRWGGTRKGAGTFYTRPQLTLPTVRRTLAPLLYESEGEHEAAVKPPEALLSLNVCDPAMGSGSFLVAVLRVLTGAVVQSLHHHDRIERVNGRTTVHCELIPEADRTLPTEDFEERLEAIVRRAVVEHCVYGVDLDPLAVELARVALWVETLDRSLPFTFLDHKLRCGDSLVGTWLDRFRDYPLLCFDRQSPDWKYKGVNHQGDVWHTALKETRKEAIEKQVEILRGQLRLEGSVATDEELKVAVDRVRRLYRELHAVPVGRPDERARIWRERIQTDAALAKVRDAFDTWCAIWFWPLDELAALPLPREFHAPSDSARSVVRRVADERRFFHWELEFPDVFTSEGAGFDAVVGNPPWETFQPQSKEFFTNHDPLYRAYGKQEGLRVQKLLFEAHPSIEDEWLAYIGWFKDISNWLKHASEPFGDAKVAGHGGGDVSLVRGKKGAALHEVWRRRRARYKGLSTPAHPFREQGQGKAYTYKMFVELGHALLREGGHLGLLVPSGLYTDKGTGELRKLLLLRCQWRWIYGFENRKKVFDIDSRFKFCVVLAEKGGATEAIRAAFMRHDLEDWAEARGALDYPAERVTAFSPNSLSILEIRSERDLEVLTRIYANSVLLGDEGPDGWGIDYAQGDFNMTSDSKLFIQRDKAEADGFRPDIYGRWVNDGEEVLLPLYEGRMIGQFDFSEKGWVSGKGRGAVWREIPWEDKRIEPQFLLNAADVFDERYRPGLKVGQMRVSSATNRRTLIATPIESHPCGDKVATLRFRSRVLTLAAPGVLNAYAFDHPLRTRVGGLQVDQHILTVSPVPAASVIPASLARVVARLAGTSEIFAKEWLETYPVDQRRRSWRRLWALTKSERLRLRAMLDGIVAILYGLSREDFSWVLKDCDHPKVILADNAFCRRLDGKGFWRVHKDQDPELRHTVLSLAAFDDLQAMVDGIGDRDAGIQAFCDQNDGDGWMLPETLCLADLGLARTVQMNQYDERARSPQPVRSRMGERFLDWQLARTLEESWEECERHARVVRESMPAPEASARPTDHPKQPSLFGEDT